MMLRKTLRNAALILTMRCDEASRLISRAQETPLRGAERWALLLHLAGCRMCRAYRRQLRVIRDILDKLADPQAYDAAISSLLDEEQARALRGRLSKRIHENLDSA